MFPIRQGGTRFPRGEQYFLGKIVRGNNFHGGTGSPLTPVYSIYQIAYDTNFTSIFSW